MASVSGRSVGVGSEVGEFADIATDESLQASAGMSIAHVRLTEEKSTSTKNIVLDGQN